MGKRVDNWEELRSLYVVHGKTARQIAVLAGISNSTVSMRARREDWDGQRLAYKSSVAQRGYEMAAATSANENQMIVSESVLIARAYLRTFAQSLKDGTVKTNAKDALEFMKFLSEQMGIKAGKESNGPRVIEGTATPVEDRSEFLRRLVEIARTRVASPGGLGGAAVDGPERARQN